MVIQNFVLDIFGGGGIYIEESFAYVKLKKLYFCKFNLQKKE